MKRDATTPLVLWICAAICVHFMFGGGASEVATIHDDRTYLHRLASDVRDRVRREEQTFDVALLDTTKKADALPPAPPPPKPEVKLKPPEKKEDQPKLAKNEPKKPEPAKKPEEKKTVVVAANDKAKPLPPPPPMLDRRIAVKQHAQANQADNPNAHFIADEANHVDQETAATLTSHDRDEANPTPGGNHAGPQGETGDSDRTKIADSEVHAGDKTRAPGERGKETTEQKDPMPTAPAQVAMLGPKTPAVPAAGGDGRTAQNPTPSVTPQLAPGAAAEPSPEVTSASEGNWTFNPVRPNAGTGAAQDQGAGSATKRPDASSAMSVNWLGLGGHPGPGQVNLNLSQVGVVAVVGSDQLRKEREADGERRRSEHRGSWIASNFERWRSAIENYVSSVKPGNQTALNTARVPFASYLNAMHNRIHPIFAESFLESLDNLPATHPMNDQHLVTKLEIVLTKDGHVHKMGIVRTSGITAFDIAALDAVQRASPYGPAPSAIVSPDGNVYLHWEFHRDEVYACSTMNARPFLLNLPTKGPDPDPALPPGSAPPPMQERGVPSSGSNESREGMRIVPGSNLAPLASR